MMTASYLERWESRGYFVVDLCAHARGV